MPRGQKKSKFRGTFALIYSNKVEKEKPKDDLTTLTLRLASNIQQGEQNSKFPHAQEMLLGHVSVCLFCQFVNAKNTVCSLHFAYDSEFPCRDNLTKVCSEGN